MSRNGEITQTWAGGQHTFRLGIGELEQHEEAIGKDRPTEYPAGPMAVLGRLYAGLWRIPDIRETVRLGLVGGGTHPVEARKLVERYVDTDLVAGAALAILILSAALGIEERQPEPSGKEAPAGKRRRAGRKTTASTSGASTAPAP